MHHHLLAGARAEFEHADAIVIKQHLEVCRVGGRGVGPARGPRRARSLRPLQFEEQRVDVGHGFRGVGLRAAPHHVAGLHVGIRGRPLRVGEPDLTVAEVVNDVARMLVHPGLLARLAGDFENPDPRVIQTHLVHAGRDSHRVLRQRGNSAER